ncbi:MAG: S1C family serine protease [Acidimicrobiales bacterium]
MTVTFLGGRTAEGEVRAADVDGDLAVLAVEPEATAGVTPLEWPTEPARLGTPVFALSNPGGRGLRVTFGTISALDQAFRGPRGRPVTGALEHTAPLPRGSSGGPVVDAGGRLLGLDVNRLGEGFYLAIPADAALRARVDALAAGTPPRATYRHLGVSVAPPAVARKLRAAVGLPERDGLLVRAVASDGPASRAGLRTGDLIVEIGGRAATSVDVLYQALAEPAGDRLALVILRGTETVEATVDFTGPTDRDDR